MNELVSIIIPTYKRDAQFEKALDSALQQSYQNIEIIVIDDNIENKFSTAVQNIILSKNDSRIRYLKNETNLGGACTRNKGIVEAKGEYIAFLDDDDCYVSNNVERKLQKFSDSGCQNLALVYGWTQSRNVKDRKVRDYKNRLSGCCLYEAMLECVAATSQWMCKKQALIDVGMFSDVPAKQDSTLMLKLLISGYEIDYVPDILSYYYEHKGERISMGTEKNLQGELLLRDFLRLHYKLVSPKQAEKIEVNITNRIITLAWKNGKCQIAKEETRCLLRKRIGICKTIKNSVLSCVFYMVKKKK